MKHFFLASAFALAASTAFAAMPGELSDPIVAFTPVIAKNADTLELTETQRADLKAWLETMPAQREALQNEAVAARAALRDAIVAGAPAAERQSLADAVGKLETQLVMMRSDCTDHWRAVLTEAQFAKMLELAAGQ
ncbi:Spy/CpxP family protein refolding chaperone [Thetidibacter halocola]|uniref:Spy/CpxP family protein refolding chaperone n=1 Tax=Thetidibacter halocola TaxID=2827239 RepID=A0A8J8B8W4_9RHOB|nr:Spy/CpxP family protein refolding chaperone [Thetidibacter halocola]MBS0125927.1 Spy/CpxP family protein refolding chaperone [Thetidibacter halocola]